MLIISLTNIFVNVIIGCGCPAHTYSLLLLTYYLAKNPDLYKDKGKVKSEEVIIKTTGETGGLLTPIRGYNWLNP